ncbi:MAG: NAD(P)/FAD-dependent oxidoreductase [Actinobacteria bacterium]|nr:MAG: NAD(P)/FAD-dependent oxidoreductase [Actinomycetota bacterium]
MTDDRNGAVVVGGGAAGLAAAATLGRAGVSAVVLEAGAEPGAAWRARYDRLHLHTSRGLSGLPGYRIPRRYGRWLARDAVLGYLREYADRNGLEVRTGTRAERIDRDDGGWTVRTADGTFAAPHVVLATGFSNVPSLADWPGREGFRGELVHSSAYRNPEPFRGRDVLVVGSGNSGAEIAVDLAQGAASRVRIAVRTPPHIARRAALGIPTQALGIALSHLPPRAGGAVAAGVRRISIPDLAAYGLPRPAERLGTQFARTGTIPILDVGFVAAVRERRVEVVAAVESLDGDEVVLADGKRIRPDVVLAATGFKAGLEPLVGHLGVLNERGVPRGREPLPGLHFIGYFPTLSGMLRLIAIDARALARRVTAAGESVPEIAPVVV